MTSIQIMNTKLDSANWIDLQADSILPTYKKHNEAKDLDGLPTASVPEGDRIGISAPTWVITGVINVDDFIAASADINSETPSTLSGNGEDGVAMASRVTLGYLKAIWRELEGQTKIRVYVGKPEAQIQLKNWNNTSTDIYIVVDDFTPKPNVDSEGLHFINFSLTCREVVADGTYV